MKKHIKLILALLFTSSLFSQIDTTKVAFVSYWSVGDSYDFKISKISKRWKDGELTKDEQQDYIANFTVIDSTDTSYTIVWRYENDLGNTYNIPEELLDRFSKYKLTEIKYKTSEVGDFIEILNWEEVSETMDSMFDDVIEVLGDKNEQQKNALKAAMAPFKQIYSTKQGIEELVVKELQYFHFPMGTEFDITEPIIYVDEIPNMFGGNPIKANAKIHFTDVDFDESFCVVNQEMDLDPNDTIKMLEQVFTQMNLDDKEMKKALETATFKINDKNTYAYYFYPGIPHRIETNREILVDIKNEKGKRIDKTIIELIYNE